MNGSPWKWDHGSLAKSIVEKSKSFAASSRGVYVSNDKIEKKVIKMKLATRSNTAMFAQMLLYTRRKFKHRGIQLIKVGDPDWLNIKEACSLATEFCNEFGLTKKMGYYEYISMGLKKMKNFSFYKFKSMHSSICNEFEAIQIIAKDKTPQRTKECHDIYLKFISEKIGFAQGFRDIPEKYQYFIKAKEEAEKYRVSSKVYIAAQFQGFEWNNSVPDPAQLVGLKSVDRLQKYAFENNIQIGNKSQNINWKKIKEYGRDNSK